MLFDIILDTEHFYENLLLIYYHTYNVSIYTISDIARARQASLWVASPQYFVRLHFARVCAFKAYINKCVIKMQLNLPTCAVSDCLLHLLCRRRRRRAVNVRHKIRSLFIHHSDIHCECRTNVYLVGRMIYCVVVVGMRRVTWHDVRNICIRYPKMVRTHLPTSIRNYIIVIHRVLIE